MKYEIGWHSEDEQRCHVALIDAAGGRDDLFDVALYDPDVIEEGVTSAYTKSVAALNALVERANTALSRDEIMAAVNAGCDLACDAMGQHGYLSSDGAYDVANIIACAIGSVLENPDVTIVEVLAENFADTAEQWREELGDEVVDAAIALQKEAS